MRVTTHVMCLHFVHSAPLLIDIIVYVKSVTSYYSQQEKPKSCASKRMEKNKNAFILTIKRVDIFENVVDRRDRLKAYDFRRSVCLRTCVDIEHNTHVCSIPLLGYTSNQIVNTQQYYEFQMTLSKVFGFLPEIARVSKSQSQ